MSNSRSPVRKLCQLCGRYYHDIGGHVRYAHNASITDLEADGKWKNERNPEE